MQKDTNLIAAVIVSIFALALFLVALMIAYYMKSDTALTLLFGAASANCTTVVSYWVGSSLSSQKKDDTIANITGNGRHQIMQAGATIAQDKCQCWQRLQQNTSTPVTGNVNS
jgi:hypothetical protein